MSYDTTSHCLQPNTTLGDLEIESNNRTLSNSFKGDLVQHHFEEYSGLTSDEILPIFQAPFTQKATQDLDEMKKRHKRARLPQFHQDISGINELEDLFRGNNVNNELNQVNFFY